MMVSLEIAGFVSIGDANLFPSMSAGHKLIAQHDRLQHCRIALKPIAHEIPCMAVHSKRPWMHLDRAILNPIAHCNLLVVVIPGKDAHLAFGWRLKQKSKAMRSHRSVMRSMRSKSIAS